MSSQCAYRIILNRCHNTPVKLDATGLGIDSRCIKHNFASRQWHSRLGFGAKATRPVSPQLQLGWFVNGCVRPRQLTPDAGASTHYRREITAYLTRGTNHSTPSFLYELLWSQIKVFAFKFMGRIDSVSCFQVAGTETFDLCCAMK